MISTLTLYQKGFFAWRGWLATLGVEIKKTRLRRKLWHSITKPGSARRIERYAGNRLN